MMTHYGSTKRDIRPAAGSAPTYPAHDAQSPTSKPKQGYKHAHPGSREGSTSPAPEEILQRLKRARKISPTQPVGAEKHSPPPSYPESPFTNVLGTHIRAPLVEIHSNAYAPTSNLRATDPLLGTTRSRSTAVNLNASQNLPQHAYPTPTEVEDGAKLAAFAEKAAIAEQVARARRESSSSQSVSPLIPAATRQSLGGSSDPSRTEPYKVTPEPCYARPYDGSRSPHACPAHSLPRLQQVPPSRSGRELPRAPQQLRRLLSLESAHQLPVPQFQHSALQRLHPNSPVVKADTDGYIVLRQAVESSLIKEAAEVMSKGLALEKMHDTYMTYRRPEVAYKVRDSFLDTCRPSLQDFYYGQRVPDYPFEPTVGEFLPPNNAKIARYSEIHTGNKNCIYVTIAVTPCNPDTGLYSLLRCSHKSKHPNLTPVQQWDPKPVFLEPGDAVIFRGDLHYRLNPSQGMGRWITLVFEWTPGGVDSAV